MCDDQKRGDHGGYSRSTSDVCTDHCESYLAYYDDDDQDGI